MQTNVVDKTYTKHFAIGYPQLEPTMAIRPSVLFNILQDMASEHAQKIDIGYNAVSQKKLMWYLLKYRAEFNQYPVSIYDLTVKTEARGWQKLFAYRDFEITAAGKLLGRVSSMWTIVDAQTGELVSAQTLDNPYMAALEKRDNDLKFEKIPQITRVDAEKTFEIRYEDIDVNGHANNINYFIWAFETLDYAFRAEKRLKTLDVVFKKEVKYGDLITSQMSRPDENTTIHVIKNASTDEDLCYLKADWSSYEI